MRVYDLLSECGIDYRGYGESPHVSEGWVGLQCPFCDAGKGNFGLGVNLSNGAVSCWKCGPHSMAAVLVECGVEPRRVKELLGGLDRWRPARREEHRGKLQLPDGIGPLGPAHRAYLEGRGFDPDELVKVWKIGGIANGGRLRWRLFIPVRLRGEVVSWTTRAIGPVGHTDRYRGARKDQEAVPKRELLYGEDFVRHAVVIVEGPVDVWAIGPGAVCPGGLGISKAHIKRLSRYPTRAVCFDAEPEAQRRARNLCRALEVFPGQTFNLVLESGKDPADVIARQSLQEARGGAISELEDIRARFLSGGRPVAAGRDV